MNRAGIRPVAAEARRRLMSSGFAAIRASRADRWLAPVARGCGLILMCHRVRPAAGAGDTGGFAPNALLEITPEFLDLTLRRVRAAGFTFVALDEVPQRLAEGGPPFAAVTFDDGYRDNLTHAAPVLHRHGVPWTVFATTEFVDGTGRLWWVELEQAIARLPVLSVEVDGSTLVLSSRTVPERRAAYRTLHRLLRAGGDERLREVAARLCDEAGIDPAALVREHCLGWAELRDLAARPGVTVGAHTVSHAILANATPGRLAAEIAVGRDILERRLGRPVEHFAYPVGDACSAGGREFAAVRAAGFRTAVTTRPGHLFPAHAAHLGALPRVSLNGLFQSGAALDALVSGVPFLAWNRGRRVNAS